MPQPLRHRWRFVAAVMGGAIFFIASVVFQNAGAIGQRQSPAPLQPPFVFHAESDSMPAVENVLPPSATPLLTETFDSGFSFTFGVTGTTGWHVFTETGSSGFYWNRVLPILSGPFQNTAWASCGSCDGDPTTGRDPDTDNYPANADAWLIYGPVDLSKYYTAEAAFIFRLNANPSVDGTGSGDFFAAGVSDDGKNFSGVQLTGNLWSAGWLTGTINLRDHAGQAGVYIGFYFHSNTDSNVGQGVFVDNVILRAAEYERAYIPLIESNYSFATPTSTLSPSLYNYVFDSGLGENDPDYVAWGQSYSKSANNVIIYEQGLADGNPGKSMYLYNTRKNTEGEYITFAGPNVTVSNNYEISAQFTVFKGKNNARYGIVFGAGNGTFGRGSGNAPTFDINTNYYRFALQFPGASGNIPTDYQIERCDGNGVTCTKLVERSTLPAGAAVDGVWDTITIRRSGNSIVVLVNNFQLLSVNDGTYTGSRKFGTFIQAADVNGPPPGSVPLEIHWDNYRVTQLP